MRSRLRTVLKRLVLGVVLPILRVVESVAPNDARLGMLIAVLILKQRKRPTQPALRDALGRMEKACAKEPTRPAWRMPLAELLEKSGHLVRPLELYRALASETLDPKHRLRVGRGLLRLQDWETLASWKTPPRSKDVDAKSISRLAAEIAETRAGTGTSYAEKLTLAKELEARRCRAAAVDAYREAIASEAGGVMWSPAPPKLPAVPIPGLESAGIGTLKSPSKLPAWLATALRLNRSLRCTDARDTIVAALSTSPRLSTWQRVFAEQLAITFAANSRWIRDAGYDEPPASQPADVWAVGTWKLGSSKARLSISGAVYRPEEATFIFLNEQILRPVNIRTPYERLNAPRSGFGFHLDGATLAEFPRRAILAVGTRGGPLVDNQTGEESQVISVPNGTGQLIPLLRSTHVINKHGRLTPRLTGATEWQTKVLGAHVRFAEYFKETFGYDLFVVYGVLLGLVREGNFIDSDDDFDIAYVSKHTAVADVKAETISIVERLSADGYTLKSNALRRMIKVLVDDVWLDCFSGWIEDGRVWMPQTTSFPGDRDVFFPLRGAELQGIDILIPNRAEYFLESVYGEKWLVPDPGYRAPSRPPEILKHIAKSYLSPAEVEELGARGVAIKFPPTKQTPA